MKTTLLITNGAKQIVLTPETKEEQYICKLFQDGEKQVRIFHSASFHIDKCQGGWYRQYADSTYSFGEKADDSSVILLLEDSIATP